MAVSFPSSTISKYGSLVLPIAADIAVSFLLSRVTQIRTAKISGLAVGAGVACFCASRTSWTIGLTGAGLYVIYKVVVNLNFSNLKPHKHTYIENLEKSFHALEQKFVFTSDRRMDVKDVGFNDTFRDLIQHLQPETDPIRNQWSDPAVLAQAKKLLIDCQTLLFQIFSRLEDATQHLQDNREARLQMMSHLLLDGSFDPDKAFVKSFFLLSRIYRSVRCKVYYIHIPNLSGVKENERTSCVLGAPLTQEYCALFISGSGPQGALNQIYNETQDRLAGLVKLMYPKSPCRIKDEQPIPGDYGNPTNLFTINTRPMKN